MGSCICIWGDARWGWQLVLPCSDYYQIFYHRGIGKWMLLEGHAKARSLLCERVFLCRVGLLRWTSRCRTTTFQSLNRCVSNSSTMETLRCFPCSQNTPTFNSRTPLASVSSTLRWIAAQMSLNRLCTCGSENSQVLRGLWRPVWAVLKFFGGHGNVRRSKERSGLGTSGPRRCPNDDI